MNAIFLYIFHGVFMWALLPAQLLASQLAIFFNFVLHDNWTYRQSTHLTLRVRLTEFQISSWVGALITLVVLEFLVSFLKLPYILGLVIGGGIATVWNYAWTRFVIWKPKKLEF